MGDNTAIEIDNDLAEIARVVGALEAFGREHALSADVVLPMTLAVDELLTNTISYGYPERGRQRISVSFAVQDGQFLVELVDSAIAFDPLVRPGPALDGPIEARPIGGLGIHFVRTLLDAVAYRRIDGQNRLTLRKKVPGSERGQD